MRSTPATLAAASIAGLTLPSLPGGVVMTVSPQPAILAGMAAYPSTVLMDAIPAILAGMASISTVEG